METREFGKQLTNLELSQLPNIKDAEFATKKFVAPKPKALQFSHFAPRLKANLSDSEVFSLAFNRDASLLASSTSNGQVQIVSGLLGHKLYVIKDD
jgi:hypothetical protein